MHRSARTPLPARSTHLAALTLAVAGLLPVAAIAQAATCSSDGARRPHALVERFTDADCGECWRDPRTRRATVDALALDWIVPGARGDDAPLSAAQIAEAAVRMRALAPSPASEATGRAIAVSQTVRFRAPPRVRVAHGLPFNGYVGASIAWTPARSALGADGTMRSGWTVWLALVESLPPGAEGSPVARNIVRNVLQPMWDGSGAISKGERPAFSESRPLSIPAGANPSRLRVVGWIEDARGRVVDIAASRCAAP